MYRILVEDVVKRMPTLDRTNLSCMSTRMVKVMKRNIKNNKP